MKINLEKIKIVKEFKNGANLRELGQKFGCSYSTIKRRLITTLGSENYKKIARTHIQESGAKNITKYNKSKEGRESSAKRAENKKFVSSWEDKFYDEYLEPIFGYDLQRQYYIPEINHRFDFAILDSRVLIEIDGDYWHQFCKKRDAEIDLFAKKAGWKVYRYNDADLKKMGII